MKKLITAALLAAIAMPAVAVPTAAFAQSGREWHRDRQDHRADRHDRNRRWGNDDWRTYRDRNRGIYARGNWRAPFAYNRFRAGGRIGAPYFGSRYLISDPWRYRLPNAGRYQNWVRHYDDVLLVDTRRGVVVRVIPGFYR